MLAVLPDSGPEPRLGPLPEPGLAFGEVLVEVRATALNRADLLQARGLYPPPPGESAVPGLEGAGVVAALGEGVTGWQVGDRVMALLGGGGQAEQVAVPAGQLMAIPEGLSFTDAAALPESCLTAWTNLVVEGRLEPGQWVLVTAASGGIGTVVVQMAKLLGARVIASGRELSRLEPLRALGADALVPAGPDLAAAVRQMVPGGVDLVFDMVGGALFPAHLAALRPGGRLVLVGLMAGARGEAALDLILSRRLQVIGSVLRPRSREEKAGLVADFATWARPHLASGALRPVIDRILPFTEIARAYQEMAAGGAVGKIVLTMA